MCKIFYYKNKLKNCVSLKLNTIESRTPCVLWWYLIFFDGIMLIVYIKIYVIFHIASLKKVIIRCTPIHTQPFECAVQKWKKKKKRSHWVFYFPFHAVPCAGHMYLMWAFERRKKKLLERSKAKAKQKLDVFFFIEWIFCRSFFSLWQWTNPSFEWILWSAVSLTSMIKSLSNLYRSRNMEKKKKIS